MRSPRSILLLLVLAVVLASACQRRPAKTEPYTMSPQFSVAVAPFTVAREPWNLLAGYLPERVSPPMPEEMARLDQSLWRLMNAKPERSVVPASQVKPCMHSAQRPSESTRLASLKYWQEVGKCAGAQFLVVPMMVHWKERQGSAAGSTSPAWVIMDVYMVNVKTGGLVNHYHYDYQQKALTDNLLEAGQFFKRHGQWVTAEDLANEGLVQALKEFGL